MIPGELFTDAGEHLLNTGLQCFYPRFSDSCCDVEQSHRLLRALYDESE